MKRTRARRKGCPACVLVVAPDAKVAAWAARPIALGLPARGEALRKKVEEMIMQAVPESREPPFVQKLKAIGRAEGLKAALFKLIARTGLAFGEEERARIDACNDPAVLDRWLDNAFGAKTAEELFQ